ncbi:heavy metal-binding domain-containing protein [Mucilaginibacter sp. OK098]|uniref:heavy metal-binding domain-containing protein n=1 Tax=Mucilaginibacter sp. OK098 TaxID=1855297 RepID=UPI000915FB50|nr:heavy metal-binding domain-containing protein [Mucilaginibacter sp. OK098]SHN36985.1 membrane fusion protein, Cu(I)/Ag(I) efflux system [Mucilaginibacter sp. OK098]
MKKIVIIIAFAGLMFSISACDHSVEKASTSKGVKKKKGKYFCTMNPDITSDKPGTCPKCGMELVERDTTEEK